MFRFYKLRLLFLSFVFLFNIQASAACSNHDQIKKQQKFVSRSWSANEDHFLKFYVQAELNSSLEINWSSVTSKFNSSCYMKCGLHLRTKEELQDRWNKIRKKKRQRKQLRVKILDSAQINKQRKPFLRPWSLNEDHFLEFYVKAALQSSLEINWGSVVTQFNSACYTKCGFQVRTIEELQDRRRELLELKKRVREPVRAKVIGYVEGSEAHMAYIQSLI